MNPIVRCLLPLAAVTCVAASFLGCGSGDLSLDEADPGAVAADPTYEQIFAIIQRECVPCHTDSDDDDESEDKALRSDIAVSSGEGASPDLRLCESIVAFRQDIINRTITKNDMPPGAWPRLTNEEKLLIQRWVENGATAPCN